MRNVMTKEQLMDSIRNTVRFYEEVHNNSSEHFVGCVMYFGNHNGTSEIFEYDGEKFVEFKENNNETK
jgi:hypothetical protein